MNKSKTIASAIFFVLCGVVLVPSVLGLYLHLGHPPVAVADPMFPGEESIAHSVLHSRVQQERAKTDMVPINETTLREGASVYMSECSFCHGVPSSKSSIGEHTFPRTPQFFQQSNKKASPVDVNLRATSYHWFVGNGVRLSAMPSFAGTLSDKEQWEVANMLAVRNTPLPESVKAILNGSAQ